MRMMPKLKRVANEHDCVDVHTRDCSCVECNRFQGHTSCSFNQSDNLISFFLPSFFLLAFSVLTVKLKSCNLNRRTVQITVAALVADQSIPFKFLFRLYSFGAAKYRIFGLSFILSFFLNMLYATRGRVLDRILSSRESYSFPFYLMQILYIRWEESYL